MQAQELNLECEIFDEFREKADAAINTVVNQLIEKGLMSGSVSMKIDIQMRKDADADSAEIVYMPEFEPKVNVKIGASGSVKCAKKGGIILKQAPCGKNIVGNNQISIDELMDRAEEGA